MERSMGSTRPGHRASRSLGGIRTSFAVLVMPPPATDFSRMTDYSPRLRFCKRVSSTCSIPSKDAGFESQEPTSPKVTCIGHIKRKPQWVKASKQEAATTPTKPAKDSSNSNNKKLSKLKKLMLGKHHISDNKEATEDDEAVEVEEEKCNLSLGSIKRFTSGSYDVKFGSMFVEDV